MGKVHSEDTAAVPVAHPCHCIIVVGVHKEYTYNGINLGENIWSVENLPKCSMLSNTAGLLPAAY